jgi:hypothetical protein
MQNVIFETTRKPQASATDRELHKQEWECINTLATELKTLLERHSALLKEEGVRRQMEKLEHWVEEQQKGPAPACVISDASMAWLSDLRDRLKMSAEEMQRLEGEGGNPPTKEQDEKMAELLKTIRRIEQIIDESQPANSH